MVGPPRQAKPATPPWRGILQSEIIVVPMSGSVSLSGSKLTKKIQMSDNK